MSRKRKREGRESNLMKYLCFILCTRGVNKLKKYMYYIFYVRFHFAISIMF